MKFKNVYKILGIMILFVTLQSRSTGPGGTANLQVTGAPGSTGNMGTCANTGCHTAGSFDPALSIELLDGTTPVSSYEPGKSYTLNIMVEPGSGTPTAYGFQAVSLDGSDSQAGAWGDLGAQKQKVSLGGRSYAEHSTPSSSNSFEMEWIAPSIGTGPVTFYSAGIAANLNSNNTGDGTAQNAFTLEEATTSSVIDLSGEFAHIKVHPNPVRDRLNLRIISRQSGDYTVRVIDVNGRTVREKPLDLRTGSNLTELNVAGISPGLYMVQLSGKGLLSTARMLKH